MQWLNKIVDDLIARHPSGEILIESGGSPSGTHHIGHMREFATADAIMLELRRRGRAARHIYFVDDLDALRKIPTDIPQSFSEYLGMPICDVPSPDGTAGQSYADFFVAQLERATTALGIDVEFIRSNIKYRSGFFVPAIERSLERIPQARRALEAISGRTLDENWTPIQILEQGRLKNRQYVSIDKNAKTVCYIDKDGAQQNAHYDKGEVKLDWRLDWPGRWWLLQVQCEPSGRDHMTKGSSYDTGIQIMKDVYEADAPYPVAYDFINMVGDTKKMSASKGTGLDAEEGSTIMPPEVVRYFILRAAPLKRLYFDPVNGVVQLMDEFAALAAKEQKTESEEQLLYICTRGLDHKTVSRVPFSLLVASYQAALRDIDKTLQIASLTEYGDAVKTDSEIIKNELRFIDAWLEKRAPDSVKFSLRDDIDSSEFTDVERAFLTGLADLVAAAPPDADGAWYHDAIYSFKESSGLIPKELFNVLYRLLIGKDSGPRAGWFLSMLPHDWLIERLRLKS